MNKGCAVVLVFFIVWAIGQSIYEVWSYNRTRSAIYEEVWKTSPELKRVHDKLTAEFDYLENEKNKLSILKTRFTQEASKADAERRIQYIEGLMARVQSNLDDIVVAIERHALASQSTVTNSDLQVEAIESLEASAERVLKDAEVLRSALEIGQFPPPENTIDGASGNGKNLDSDSSEVSGASPLVPAGLNRVWEDARGNGVTGQFLGVKGLDGEWVDSASEASLVKFQERIQDGYSFSIWIRRDSGQIATISLSDLKNSDRELILEKYFEKLPQSKETVQ